MVDWGLAKDLTSPALETPGLDRDRREFLERTLIDEKFGAFGTPRFMAPEQALRFRDSAALDDVPPITPASDIFSLGAILYQILTSKPPPDLSDASQLRIRLLGEGDLFVERAMPLPNGSPATIASARTRDQRGDTSNLSAMETWVPFQGLSPCADHPRRGVPQGLDAICRKATATRPADRYESARGDG